MTKKRKVRYDRIVLLVLIAAALIIALVLGIKMILGKPAVDDNPNNNNQIVESNDTSLELVSYDVYKAFIDRKTDINIIPGIEIDVDIDEIKDSKHMLFYFNIDLEKLEDFSKKINDYMNNRKSVKIEKILDFFRFSLSSP